MCLITLEFDVVNSLFFEQGSKFFHLLPICCDHHIVIVTNNKKSTFVNELT